MAQTVVYTSSAGISNEAVIKIDTDATTAARTLIPLGFTPRYVAFHQLTDRISFEWFAGMTAAYGLKTVAAGTRTLETSGGITVSTPAAPVTVVAGDAIAMSGTIAAAGASTIPVGTVLPDGVVVIPAAQIVASKSHVLVARG